MHALMDESPATNDVLSVIEEHAISNIYSDSLLSVDPDFTVYLLLFLCTS